MSVVAALGSQKLGCTEEHVVQSGESAAQSLSVSAHSAFDAECDHTGFSHFSGQAPRG